MCQGHQIYTAKRKQTSWSGWKSVNITECFPQTAAVGQTFHYNKSPRAVQTSRSKMLQAHRFGKAQSTQWIPKHLSFWPFLPVLRVWATQKLTNSSILPYTRLLFFLPHSKVGAKPWSGLWHTTRPWGHHDSRKAAFEPDSYFDGDKHDQDSMTHSQWVLEPVYLCKVTNKQTAVICTKSSLVTDCISRPAAISSVMEPLCVTSRARTKVPTDQSSQKLQPTG